MSRYGRTQRCEIQSRTRLVDGKWARVKSTRRPRILHLSAGLVHHRDPETGLRSTRVARPGKTYRREKTPLERSLDALPGRQRRKVRKYIAAAQREAA